MKNRKIIMLNTKKLYILLNCSLSLLIPSLACAEPSKKETAEFILEKIRVSDYGIHNCNRSANYKVSSFSNGYCTMMISTTYYRRSWVRTRELGDIPCSDNLIGNITDKVVNLADIDPDRIEYHRGQPGYPYVLLEVRGNKEKIIEFGRKTVSGLKTKRYTYMFSYDIFNSELNGPKVERAFKHLVKLCGGKGELF